MTKFRSMILRAVLPLIGAFALSPSAHAAWPDKPITLVVGYAAGGSVDVVARLISVPLGIRLGQPVVIENIGGAGGSIGATRVARAKADGYTLMVGSGSEVAIAWAVNPGLKYNGLKDLAPVGLIATSPMVLVGNKTVPANNLAALLEYGKANRGKLSLATSGVGTPQHLLLEYINKKTGGEILHVPYRSAGSIVQDVIGGRVDLSILTLSSALPFITAGTLQAFAVTGTQSAAPLTSVPSLTQYPGLQEDSFELWFGMLAPASIPEAIAERLNTELNAVLQQPDVAESLKKIGMNVSAGTPVQFGAYIKADSNKYQKIIKDAGIVVN